MNTYDLMIPGPVAAERDVLLELAAPIVAHYGSEWAAYYEETVDFAKSIFQTRGDLFINVGSGHLVVEAALASLVEPGAGVIAVVNGHFAQRMADIAAAHEADVHRLEVEWGKTVLPEQVEEALAAHPAARVVALVHHETSTGLVNPVERVAEVCRRRGVILMVDGVSAIGGIDLRVDEWGIDVCAAASQKCLEAPPGLALVSVSDRAWEHMMARRQPVRGWYLNLLRWKEFADAGRGFQQYFNTMAVGNVRALHQSMTRVLEEGLPARFARHREVGMAFRDGVRRLGLEPVGRDDEMSGVVGVFWLPAGHADTEFVTFLQNSCGIQVAGGLGQLAGKTARVGHMGPGARLEKILPVLQGLERWLASIGSR